MYNEVTTKDGSTTFFNEEVQETYHSESGAEEEAKKKYAEPVKKFLNKKDEIVIYDVCFGLGYNTAATLDEIKEKKIRIYCFENDKKILEKITILNPSFQNYPKIKEFTHKFLTQKKEEQLEDNTELRMKYGDFKEKIKETIEPADYVLYDPFSPTKTPEMWSENIFKEIYKKMNPSGLLLTYSCARKVRDNMKKAGFEVYDGPIVGRRSPSTIAKKPIRN